MDNSPVTEYIVHRLGQHVSRNDLIFDLCQRTGQSWDQASALVASVEEQQQSRIATRQSPILLLGAVGIFIVGSYFACTGLLYFVDLINAGTLAVDPLALRRDYVMVIRTGTGLAMIIGSLVGLFMLVRKLLPKSTK